MRLGPPNSNARWGLASAIDIVCAIPVYIFWRVVLGAQRLYWWVRLAPIEERRSDSGPEKSLPTPDH